jgi:hypothetical protein
MNGTSDCDDLIRSMVVGYAVGLEKSLMPLESTLHDLRSALPLSRRQMLSRCGTGLGMLALAGVCSDDAARAADPLSPKSPHFAPKAKHVVHLFMNGGPSQVDTFDPKPALDKYHGL